MSLNFEKNGKPLCKIVGGKLNNKIVYCCGDEDDEDKNSFKSLKLNLDAKFQHIPNTNSERDIIYCTGPSGSGKSTYVRNYIMQYRKAYKHNNIYLFSHLKEDETLDEIPNLKRVKIDDSLHEDPLNVEDFKDSCTIFDDIDVIGDKKIREAVYTILNQILEVGRHHKVSCLITNHLPTGGNNTRRILNEAHCVVYFPSSGTARQLNYLLKDYVGLDKNDIKFIKKCKSRWCCIFKNYPMVAMCERNIYLLNNDDD